MISDRLNTLNSGQKTQVDKIIKISNDSAIGFSGPTELCKYICDKLIEVKHDMSFSEISQIISSNYYRLKRESGLDEDVEFILIQYINSKIRVWKIINGSLSNEMDPSKTFGIGLYMSIIPHLEIITNNLTSDQAVGFGTNLIAWVSRIDSRVGNPEEFGCNVLYVNGEVYLDQVPYYPEFIRLDRMLYNFNDASIKHDIIKNRNPLFGKKINIGVTVIFESNLEEKKKFYEEIIKPEINNYCKKLGYDLQFDFIIEACNGQANIALEKTQKFKEMGIDMIIGHPWSSMCAASLSYVNENNMLLFSPSASAPTLSIPNDNLFRLCPIDNVQSMAIARILQSYGIKEIFEIQRADSWGDGIWNVLKENYTKNRGIILGYQRYPPELSDFSSILNTADEIIGKYISTYGEEKLGIHITSFGEIVEILKEAKKYSNLLKIKWFGTDSISCSSKIVDEALDIASLIKIFSPLAIPTWSSKFRNLQTKYFNIIGKPLNIYNASEFDIAWIITKSIIETNSLQIDNIKQIIPEISNMTMGYSGWCTLNNFGDRMTSDYDIFGYCNKDEDKNGYKVYGTYDGIWDKVIWDKR